jgi:hypothetical protein
MSITTPPSNLTERVLASQSVSSPRQPGLVIIDGEYDTLASPKSAPARLPASWR